MASTRAEAGLEQPRIWKRTLSRGSTQHTEALAGARSGNMGQVIMIWWRAGTGLFYLDSFCSGGCCTRAHEAHLVRQI